MAVTKIYKCECKNNLWQLTQILPDPHTSYLTVGAGRYFRPRMGQYAVKTNDFLVACMHKKPKKKLRPTLGPQKTFFVGRLWASFFLSAHKKAFFVCQFLQKYSHKMKPIVH